MNRKLLSELISWKQSETRKSLVIQGLNMLIQQPLTSMKIVSCNSIYYQWVVPPGYWTSDGLKAEIDFLVQYKNRLYPIEIKAGTNVRGKSLYHFSEHYQSKLRLRYSLQNLRFDGDLLNILLYLISKTKRFVELASVNTV